VDIKLKIWVAFYFQAKKSKEDLKEITHKVYFDVEIDGKPAGMFFFFFFCELYWKYSWFFCAGFISLSLLWI
jgi:hypothetical protein